TGAPEIRIQALLSLSRILLLKNEYVGGGGPADGEVMLEVPHRDRLLDQIQQKLQDIKSHVGADAGMVTDNAQTAHQILNICLLQAPTLLRQVRFQIMNLGRVQPTGFPAFDQEKCIADFSIWGLQTANFRLLTPLAVATIQD